MIQGSGVIYGRPTINGSGCRAANFSYLVAGWMTWERFRCNTDCETYPDECIRLGKFPLHGAFAPNVLPFQ